MVDRRSHTSIQAESLEQVTRPEVLIFKRELAKADARLFPLRQTTGDGKRLFIAARRMPRLPEVDHKAANAPFWKLSWAQKLDGVIAIDVYVEEESSRITPLGHIDWGIEGDQASGAGNVHGAFLPQNKHEELAQKRWADPKAVTPDFTGFKLEDDHHRRSIGTLMLATSGVVLSEAGAKSFFSGALLDPAVKTYNRFGIQKDEFVSDHGFVHLPIERLSRHSKTDEVISEFV